MLIEERILTLFRRNCQHTLTYWSVFFSFGLSIAFLGPTILDLKCQTGSTLQEITWVFFSQQLCLLIGSSIGGAFTKTLFWALIALFLSSLIISVVFAIIPLCYNVLLLAVAMAVSGLAMGIIDTIANIQLVSIYKKDSAIFLQALHFFIGLGALVSPLIADPFISEHCLGSNSTENATEIIHHFRSSFRSPVILAENSPHSEPVEEKANVAYAFWIMALINLPVPIVVFVLMYQEKLLPFCPNSTPRLLDKDELAMETKAPEGTEISEPDDAGFHHGGHGNIFSCCMNGSLHGLPVTFFGIHILGGLVLFMTEGIMGVYAGFVYTYAVSAPMSLHAKMAAYLNCIFWAAVTAGRLVSIPLSYRFRSVHLLVVNLAGVIVTLLLLLILYTNRVFLFVGTTLLGLFISSVFPCLVAYTEDILEYRGCATTVLVTTAGMGEMTLQVLVGSLIQKKGTYSFLVCGLGTGCLGFVFFLSVILCNRIHRNLTGTSKKAAMVEASPAPAPPASEKAAPEHKVAVKQIESIKYDSR
ncbi:major facilitator superfamily domain-containing protein 4B-like [Sinocyclocheilus anshuiensis]|uniref:major facilitator superfamily domain-containing protein 4B-like n=1 Tax=Sinocyclocheilus anshuiensis TaxID=1608454 RepID=UPI0007BA9818|nr:PREDICTED: major facilitator superfamily domain-containing protein 4B-like [Sinocyclocheilus anshuiensis]